ncbi:hypothetical protein BHE74_00053991 [Ensete ventricosum]|nr:hypothetical protein BHE74_00053991 [Ensete ventricosum]
MYCPNRPVQGGTANLELDLNELIPLVQHHCINSSNFGTSISVPNGFERRFSPGDGEMHQQSFTVDGFFLIVKEGVAEMIKFLANEPSVGLFFVEQHAQTSMLYLGLKVCVSSSPPLLPPTLI